MRSGLSILIFLHLFGIGYLLLFQPAKNHIVLFDANNLEPGNYTNTIDLSFHLFQDSPTPQIIKNEQSSQAYLQVHIPQAIENGGFGLIKNMNLPLDAVMEIDWRYTGEFNGTQIDIIEQSPSEENLTAIEVFSYFILNEQEDWHSTQIPLQNFYRNQYQAAENAKDGVLNSSNILEIVFVMKSESFVTINLRKVAFEYSSDKWVWITGLTISAFLFTLLLLWVSKFSIVFRIVNAYNAIQKSLTNKFPVFKQWDETSFTSFNVTYILQILLILILISNAALFFYIIVNPSLTHQSVLFNASEFRSGELAESQKSFLSSFQSSTKLNIVDDQVNGSKFLRVQVPEHVDYPGFGFTSNISLNPNALINIEWRYLGSFSGLQIDLHESSLKGFENEQGETYSTNAPEISEDWIVTQIPVSSFAWNQYQSNNPSVDKIFNTNAIQSLKFLFLPGDEAVLDIRSIRFLYSIPQWYLLLGIGQIFLIGILLLLRTTRSLLSNTLDSTLFPNRICVRLVYICFSLVLFHMFWNATLTGNSLIIVIIVTVIFGLVFYDEIINISIFPMWGWQFRYLLLFTVAWFSGLTVTPLGLFLWLFAVSIPVLQQNSSMGLYLPVLVLSVCLPNLLSLPTTLPIETILMVSFFLIFLLGLFKTIHNNVLAKLEIENKAFLYEELFNHTSDAIFSFDTNGIIRNVNRGAEQMLNIPQSKLLGSNITSLIHPGDHEQLPVHSSNPPDNHRMFDLRFLKSGNKVIHANISERQSIHSNQIRGYQFIARDISKRIELEQIIKDKELAEKANEFKSMFLANMSHELRTPLHGVFASLEIVRSENLTETQKKFLEMADSSGRMLLELVNDILDFSRIERGELVLEKSEISITNTIHDVRNIIQKQADVKDLDFQVHYPDLDNDMFMGDSLRIRQILLNLLGNAVKFTEKGIVKLSVSVESETLDEVCFKFMVTDSGIGIQKEKLKDIFNVFIQSDSSTTRLYGGTGLGLAISKELVQLLGGEIKVESKLGEGSTFWFIIPLQKEKML